LTHLNIVFINYCPIARRKIKREVEINVYLGVPGAVTVSSLVLCPQFSFSMSRLYPKKYSRRIFYTRI
jgi:hypothetical protein